MALAETDRMKLEQAIAQLRSDIGDLEAEIPRWDNLSTSGTKKYRPISRRITASVKRLEELVHEHTYSS